MNIPVIAIDGAAGSGKGTLARLLAKKLNFNCLDSGKIYRLVAWRLLEGGPAPYTEAAACKIARELTVDKNIFTLLRKEELSRPEVGELASQLAVGKELRKELLAVQRAAQRLPGLVADGRDMQTTVFPGALLKVFLECPVEVRAQRRLLEFQEKNINITLPEIITQLKERDHRDSNRESSPLLKAADAITVNTAAKTPEELAELINKEFKKRVKAQQQEKVH